MKKLSHNDLLRVPLLRITIMNNALVLVKPNFFFKNQESFIFQTIDTSFNGMFKKKKFLKVSLFRFMQERFCGEFVKWIFMRTV
jgi:hypothetical protein